MPITEFSLKDVRCFAGEHSLRIRPLTFLVGENSTGKSTILGCMQAMADLERHFIRLHSMVLDFNRSPYQMGSFREIVRKSSPLNTCFELGITHGEFQYRITLSERKGGTEPIVVKQEWKFPKGKLVQEIAAEPSLELTKEPGMVKVTKQLSEDGPIFTMQTGDIWLVGISNLRMLIDLHKEGQELSKTEKELFDLLTEYNDMPRRPDLLRVGQMTSIAPLRSAPRRTYDPVGEFQDPSGADIPMRLMNLARNDKKAWESLQTQLIDFGKASGLFTDFLVRQLGKSGSNPFQIQVKTHGPMVNLIDTGYGVSQILPILAKVLVPSDQMMLVQQPEVHLHPRGQAELTTLLVKCLAARRRPMQRRSGRLPGCVIETHSDYMLDRARIEIRRGNIAPDDVSLIYLEKIPNKGVQPHNITFDKMGNMENVPPSYGEFFLREGDSLLGFDANGEQ